MAIGEGSEPTAESDDGERDWILSLNADHHLLPSEGPTAALDVILPVIQALTRDNGSVATRVSKPSGIGAKAHGWFWGPSE